MKDIFNIVYIITFSGFLLIASEAYFLVTNSNRTDFYTEGEPQDMSSGLFSSYINDGNPDFEKIKAKGGVLIDFDLDGDLDLTYGYRDSYYFKNDECLENDEFINW